MNKIMPIDLTIVIPALNEEKRIGKTLDELAEYINNEPFFSKKNIEILVVSADSKDKTHQIVTQKADKFKNLKLLRPGPRVGKGRDVKYGMLRAKGEAVIFMDADMATPIKHLKKFYKSFENGAEVVIATRNLRSHHSNYLRRSISNLGNIAYKMLGGVWIEDSQCGFKMFSKNASKYCFSRLTITNWAFDMEILTIAKTNSFHMVTHRINDWVNVPDGTFNSGILENSISTLKDLFKIFINRLKGTYRT